MDFEFIREQTPLYVEAAKLTLHMAVIGVLLAIVVGLICSMIKYFRIPVLRQIVDSILSILPLQLIQKLVHITPLLSFCQTCPILLNTYYSITFASVKTSI